MINTINSDLIRGNINTIILKALYEGDRYGYDIVKEIEQKSSGQYKLKQPTLYSCLKRLEVQGFIRSYWGAKSNGGRRKYYTLTDMGRDVFKKNKDEWEFSRTVIDKLISDKEYDLSKLENSDELIYDEVTDESDVLNRGETEYTESIGNLFGGQLIGDDELYAEENLDAIPEATELFGDENEVAASLISVPSSGQNLSAQPEKEFLDTTQILNELFDTQNDDNSYINKLVNEKYTGSANARAYSSDTYFNDFTDSITNDINSATNTEAVETNEIISVESDIQNQSPYVEQENNIQYAQAAVRNGFLSYNTPIESKKEDKQIIEREYKSALGRLLEGQNFSVTNEPKSRAYERTALGKTTDKNGPLTDEMRMNIAKVVESKTLQREKTTGFEEQQFIPSSKEDILNRNLNKMAEQTKQFTGDTVKNRVYDSRIDTFYRTQYHYYSNKLKLFQFAILFGIMMIEIILTFLIVRVGMKIYQQHDAYFYILSILLAVALPISAAVMNFIDSDRIKTGEFRTKELKESLFYKIWIMACCLIIIYCVNIFLKMPVSFSKDYLATLLLPSLLTLCFPLSSVIFYFLYNSRRFNRT